MQGKYKNEECIGIEHVYDSEECNVISKDNCEFLI